MRLVLGVSGKVLETDCWMSPLAPSLDFSEIGLGFRITNFFKGCSAIHELTTDRRFLGHSLDVRRSQVSVHVKDMLQLCNDMINQDVGRRVPVSTSWISTTY